MTGSRGWLLLVGFASGCALGGGERDWTFEGATGLSIELGSGDVLVESSGDDLLYVSYDGGGVGKAARPDVHQEGGEVVVDARTALGGGDLSAQVPDGIPIDVKLDRGDATIELAAPASVSACVGAGEVSIGLPAGEYDLDLGAGAGEISAEITDTDGAPHVIHACAGAGSVRIYVYDPASEG